MFKITFDGYRNPILIDKQRSLRLEILGWDDGSINYRLQTLIKEDEIDHGNLNEGDPELTKIFFETIYNYLLKKNGL